MTAASDLVSVNITSGESQWLPIKDVGRIYIQGPARLELLGSTRARLIKGRVRVRITDPRGRGFVVETPRGEVTDLGTIWGRNLAWTWVGMQKRTWLFLKAKSMSLIREAFRRMGRTCSASFKARASRSTGRATWAA
jgi:hypothetical protein